MDTKMHHRVTQIYAYPQLSQKQIASFAAALVCVINSCIDALDILAGDPDLELNRDEADGNNAEDDFGDRGDNGVSGPGCPISDGDSAVDDGPCDEPYMDLKPDTAGLIPIYGPDQTKLPINLYGEVTVR